MMLVFSGLLEVWTFLASIFLIIGGITKNDRFNIAKPLKKRMLIIGGILLGLIAIVKIPEIYYGFMHSLHANGQ